MTDQAADTTQQSVQSEPNQSSFAIPESYADRGWAAEGKIKSVDDLFKAYDNSQSLLGKRPAGIPAANASQEEWDKFYQTMGRPDDPTAYQLDSKFEGLPEDLDLSKFEDKAKSFFHKLGLSNEKANQAWRDYISMELEAVGEMKQANEAREAELDKEFDALGKSMFGDQFKDVTARAEQYLNANLPEELKGVVDTIRDNPKAMLAMVSLAEKTQAQIKEVKTKYGAEDTLQSGGQNAGMTVHDINRQIIEAKEKYSKAPVFSKEREDAQNEVNALREQLKRVAR